MRRARVSIVLAMCLSAMTVGAVSAAPDKGCSNGGFTAFAVDWAWEFGDGVPAAGADAW